MGIAIATGAIVSMVGFALGLQAKVEEPFQKMELLNRIDVLPRSTNKDVPGESFEKPPSLDQAAVDQIAALPGVALAYPDFRLEGVEVIHADKRHKASAVGLPAEAAQLAFVRESLLAGRFLASRGEVVLAKKLAQDLGFVSPADATGQPLTLEVRGLIHTQDANLRAERRNLPVTVAGVWDPPGGQHGFTSDGLVLPLETIRELPGVQFGSLLERLFQGRPNSTTTFGRVAVRVRRPGDLFIIEQKIKEIGFETQTLLGRLKELRTGFILMDLVLTAVGSVALVVAGLGIINTQLMAVLERYREIGTYKALGASDGDVRVLFLGEAALVGLLGGLGGLLLGRVVSWIIEMSVNSVASRYEVDEPLIVFAFPLYLLGGAVLFALLVSIASGVYPASRAARIDPIPALRAE
jgi:putative ABC transport system permease protein